MELLIRVFKSTVLNMFYDLKETMGKKLKKIKNCMNKMRILIKTQNLDTIKRVDS